MSAYIIYFINLFSNFIPHLCKLALIIGFDMPISKNTTGCRVKKKKKKNTIYNSSAMRSEEDDAYVWCCFSWLQPFRVGSVVGEELFF